MPYRGSLTDYYCFGFFILGKAGRSRTTRRVLQVLVFSSLSPDETTTTVCCIQLEDLQGSGSGCSLNVTHWYNLLRTSTEPVLQNPRVLHCS